MKQTGTTSPMNRTILLTLGVILMIALSGACKNPFFMPDQEQDSTLRVSGTGSLAITTGQPSARTILPELPAIEEYDIRLTRSGHTTVVIAGHPEATKTVTDLATGQWTVTVDAKAGGLVIASGSSPVTVVVGEVTPVTVTLEYFRFVGQGDLVVDIAFPDTVGVDAAEYLKTPMGAAAVGPFALVITDDAGDISRVTVSETGVAAGSYILTTRFKRAGVLIATVVEAVHVYGNLTTSSDADPEIILLAEDFNAPPPAPDAGSVILTDNTANAAVVSWTALTSYTETGFVVERHESEDFSDEVPVQFNGPANATSYTDTSVVPGTISYYYRVKAINTFGESDWTAADSGIVVTYVRNSSYTISNNTTLLAYPGYTVIRGNLSIDSITLTDLAPLVNLQRIEGNLTINSNSGLTSLAGLENLAEVTGQIYLTGNPNLTSLSGLGVQGEVGSINITNTSLSSLAGLEGITSTGGIYLQGNAALTNLAGLAGITSIGAELTVYNHANLTDITFPYLESVTTYINIFENHKLANTSFPSLTMVGTSFIYNTNGRDVTGESSLSAPILTAVGNRIELDGYGNSSPYTQGRLTGVTLGSFGTPLIVGATGSEKFIKIMEWPNLGSISMNGLSVVHGYLEMNMLPACNAVSFESLETVGGYLRLDNVDSLTVVGFPQLGQIGQYLAIQYNNALASIESFGTGLSIGQSVTIYQNPVLAITTGLEGITGIGAELYIAYNGPPSGSAILSMPGLETVGTYVSIGANGFQTVEVGVQEIGTSLTVNLNDRVEVVAFDRLQTVGTSIWFSGNGKDGPGYAASFPTLTSVGSQVEFDGYYDYSPYSQGKLASLVLGHTGIPLTIGATGSSANNKFLKIHSNPSLTSIQAEGLTQVHGELYLGSNTNCATIALSALESVGGRLEVYDQDKITTLAFPALTSVPSHLRITHNNLLAAITSLGTGLAVGGELEISSNPALIDTSGLEAITSVGSYLNISWNGPAEGGSPSLGMSNLASVGDYLSINDNNFTTISLSVTEIAGYLSIAANNRLETLALDQLSTVGTYFNLLYNGRYGSGLTASFAGLTWVNGNVTINDYYNGWNSYFGALQSLTLGSGTTGTPVPLIIGTNGTHKLEINSAYSLTSLAALGLVTVNGDVLINGLAELDTLAGLENLETVEGYLEISYCPKLTSLFGTNGSLTTVTEHLQINNNNLLANLSGLAKLETIGIQTSGTKGLHLDYNPALTGLQGLENLRSVTGKVTINNCDNVAFTSLAGLSSLGNGAGSVVGGLEITGMENLQSLDGLVSLTGIIPGSVWIGNNPRLESIAGPGIVGLGAVTEISGDLILLNMAQLEGLALPGLQIIGGSFMINDCDFVPNLDALVALETVSGNLTISGNAILTDLGDTHTRGLCNLATVGGYLNLSANAVLRDISALGLLTVIGSALDPDSKNGYLNLYMNQQLSSIQGLRNITEIRGNLTVNSCGTGEIAGYELTNLYDLAAVQTINGALRIQNNSKLTTLFGPETSLAIIKGDTDGTSIYINNNAVLQDLVGLSGSSPGLTVNHVSISSNPELVNLSGLDNITDVNNVIEIRHNSKLTAFPAMPGLATITSTLYLYDNGSGSTGITTLGFTGLTQVSNVTIQQNYFDSSSFADNTAVQTAAAGWHGAIQSISNNSFSPGND